MATLRSDQGIDWVRVALLATAASLSLGGGYYLYPLISGNKDAVNAIITVFSILAGFLIAVTTLLTEPVLKAATTWSELQTMRSTLQRKFRRYQLLFFLYLLCLGLAIATYVIPQALAPIRSALEYTFTSLSIFVFLCSLFLPTSLMQAQMERYDATLKEKAPQALVRAMRDDT